jgi:HK97 family phage prohead protease
MPETTAIPATPSTKILTDLEVKQVDEGERTIIGYAATFGNLDLNGDIIHQKAFDRCLKEKTPSDIAVFVGHNSAMLPIGIPVEMRVDDRGLWTKTRIFKTQAGDDLLQTARELHNAGQPLGMSIGFQTRDSKWQTKDGKTYRLLTDADLMEYSYAAKQVIASPPALVTAVKTRAKGAGMANEHFLPGEEPVWTTAYIQSLPDSAFAYVEEGGEQVEGKTLPHTMRHFPHHNEDGSVNAEAVRRELARAKTSEAVRMLRRLSGSAAEDPTRHLRDHARAEGLIGDGAKVATDAINEISATFADLSIESAEVARALTVGARLGVDGQKVGVRLKGTMRAKLRSIKAALDELMKWAEKAEEDDDEDDEDEEKAGHETDRDRFNAAGKGEDKRKTRAGRARRALGWAENASLIAWNARASTKQVADGELDLADLHNGIEHLETAIDMIENAISADEEHPGEHEEDKQSPFDAPGRRRRIDEGEVDGGGRDRGSRKAWDPDNDGDDDSHPAGDSDHDWWTADGRQKRPVPPGAKGSKRRKAALVGGAGEVVDELRQADVDMLSFHDSIHGDHKMGRKLADGRDIKQEWTSQYINDLPDSAFAMVYTNEAGQKERKLPHHNSDGSLSMPHLRNALARLPQVEGDPQDEKDRAERHLERHAQDEEIGERGENEESMRKMRRNGNANGTGSEKKERNPVGYVVALKDMEATLARYSQPIEQP